MAKDVRPLSKNAKILIELSKRAGEISSASPETPFNLELIADAPEIIVEQQKEIEYLQKVIKAQKDRIEALESRIEGQAYRSILELNELLWRVTTKLK